LVVFGVALDFCVSCVLQGLARYSNIKLSLLSDATKGLGARPDEERFAQFREKGVQVITLSECERRLSCG
jgi:hypothetical protein